jgi:flagellar hook-associated protein 3 FlgL
MSTAGLHNSALQTMSLQQSSLSKLQSQIALGRRVNTPADDPVASVHIMELQRSLQETEQYGSNADMAKNRLSMEESSIANVTTALQRVQELTLQANNATMDDTSRKQIATEIRARLSEIKDIANQRDGNNEYLFSGFSTKSQPFSQTGTSITYSGDQGTRLLQVGPTQKVADSNSGYEVFMNMPEGNGTFVANYSASNTGTAIVGATSVSDRSQWIPGDYTITFDDAAGHYQIFDSGTPPVAVSSGTYTQGSTIAFNGVKIDLSGMPANGDTVKVSAARTQDLFTTLNNLVTSLEKGATTDTEKANFNSDMARTLQQLDVSQDHMSSIRAQIGARLSTLDNAESAREDQKVQLQSMTSDLRDLDYASAITKMNQQLVGLQAAQQSYARISQLSLFDYLR